MSLIKVIPAPAGTYAIVDARDDAELDALVPLYVDLVPVVAWSVDTGDECGVDAIPIGIRELTVLEDGSAIAYLMPDGKIASARGVGSADSVDQFVKAFQEWETERGAPLGRRAVKKLALVAGGAR
jgi:hypothetical protein